MWPSSHMGPRGFRVSLAQIAAKEDYIRGRSIITYAIVDEYCATVERVKGKHGTLPPPGREGYCLMWSILGCAAGQDIILVSVPKRGKLFYAHLPQPGMVSTIDIPFHFSVLNRARVSNPQHHPYTQALVKTPFLPPLPHSQEPEGTGVARLCRT